MRILVTTLPFKTHLYPRGSVGWALRAAGNEACVATGPELVYDITVAGLAEEPSFARASVAYRERTLGTLAPSDIVPLLERLAAKHAERGRGAAWCESFS